VVNRYALTQPQRHRGRWILERGRGEKRIEQLCEFCGSAVNFGVGEE